VIRSRFGMLASPIVNLLVLGTNVLTPHLRELCECFRLSVAQQKPNQLYSGPSEIDNRHQTMHVLAEGAPEAYFRFDRGKGELHKPQAEERSRLPPGQ